MNPITRLRRALFRAADVLPERLVTGWGSDVAAGPLPSTVRSESACYPRCACDCGTPRVAMCGAAGCVPAMTRDEAAHGRENGGE